MNRYGKLLEDNKVSANPQEITEVDICSVQHCYDLIIGLPEQFNRSQVQKLEIIIQKLEADRKRAN